MPKNFNGVFRGWISVENSDRALPPIIWGQCVVHLSQPEFSGRVLHTSGILAIEDRGAFKMAETRNNFYALLGPEYPSPAGEGISAETFLQRQQCTVPRIDQFARAAANADQSCIKCKGSGILAKSARRFSICGSCCKHNLGWWLLEGGYGENNGSWACKAGCGKIVDEPTREIEFLPRAVG